MQKVDQFSTQTDLLGLLEQIDGKRLVSIKRRVLDDPDELASSFEWLLGLDLDFGESTLHIEANPDDDTLVLSLDPREPAPDELVVDGSTHPLWRPLIGQIITFSWASINSRGYFDSIQLAFDTYAPAVSIVVAGSQLHEYYYHEADRRVLRPAGDYTSTSKRRMRYQIRVPPQPGTRGRLPGVEVEFANGDIHRLTFVSKRHVMKRPKIGDTPWRYAEPGLVIVEKLTQQAVSASIHELALNGYFDSVPPTSTTQLKQLTISFVYDLLKFFVAEALDETDKKLSTPTAYPTTPVKRPEGRSRQATYQGRQRPISPTPAQSANIEARILSMIRNNPGMGPTEITNKLGITLSSANKTIQDLTTKNQIRMKSHRYYPKN